MRYPIHFMFGSRYGYHGWRIEWHYIWFDQIQDGGSVAILENSNGDKSTTGHPIHSMFGSRYGFWGQWIKWHYFRLKTMRED